jgi:hypothetical protein
VQFAATATLVPQVLLKTNEDALAPVTEMLEMASGAVPVLVRVTDWEALAVPKSWLPKDRLVADRVGGVSRPVPLSAMD